MPNQIDFAGTILSAMIQELGPKDFAIALSNANCHGAAFIKAGYEGVLNRDDDKLLNEWHKAVDVMIKVGKNVENY